MLNPEPRTLNPANLLFVAITAIICQLAKAQLIQLSPAVYQFDLAEGVELDRAEGTVPAQLERVKAFLADRKWDEAVDTLCQLMENSEGKLLGVTENRFVGLREYCQMQLASLPPDALKLYRFRVDPVVRKWYEDGVANHDPRLLRKSSSRPLPAVGATTPFWPWATWPWSRAITPLRDGIGNVSFPIRRPPGNLRHGPDIRTAISTWPPFGRGW